MSEAVVPVVAQQFDNIEQQRDTDRFGMWVFLATEVLFFGGLFLAYTVYRFTYAQTFAEASRHLDDIFGGSNTAVLLFSSLIMALAVRAAVFGQKKLLVRLLLLTAFLGLVFMTIKGFEYRKDFIDHLVPGANFQWRQANPRGAELFFWLYFAMTGLHAVHVTIGVCLMLVLAVLASRGKFTGGNYMPVEIVALYWHFVDLVWIFLFPLLYLAGHR